LLQDARSKFQEAILNIYERHVGVERTAEVQARGIQKPVQSRSGDKEGICSVCFGCCQITLSAVIQSNMAIHLLTNLQSRGVDLAAAVAFGTLVDPSQVLARVLEMIIGRRFHPVWTMVASTALVAGGLTFLLLRLPVIAVGLVLYGAGMGIMSIARGTVPPRASFGPSGYAVLIGRLALPSLLAPCLEHSY
jgi:hypothetical protein